MAAGKRKNSSLRKVQIEFLVNVTKSEIKNFLSWMHICW